MGVRVCVCSHRHGHACCVNGLTIWKEGGGTCRAWRVRPLGPRAELLPHRASRKPQLCICNTGAWWARDPRDTPPRQHPLNPQCGTHILVQGWVAVEHAQGLLHQHIGFHQGACGHTELTDLSGHTCREHSRDWGSLTSLGHPLVCALQLVACGNAAGPEHLKVVLEVGGREPAGRAAGLAGGCQQRLHSTYEVSGLAEVERDLVVKVLEPRRRYGYLGCGVTVAGPGAGGGGGMGEDGSLT